MVTAINVFKITLDHLRAHRDKSIIPISDRLRWARETLHNLKFQVSVNGQLGKSKPALLVSNHISYIDIPLILASFEDCVFVSKKEVASWPIIGSAAKKVETVFVDRKSPNSRQLVREEIRRQLLDRRKRVVIFPSGTTSISGERLWKKGSFEIAYELGIPVQPLRIRYSPLRVVAYVEDDVLPIHLLKLAQQRLLKADLELHPEILIKDVESDMEYCRRWSNGLLDGKVDNCHLRHDILTQA